MALECTLQQLANLDQTDPDAMQALLQSCTSALLDPLLWEWALAITLGCAIVGALIGLAKGRWLAGLLWGAALGPIGWTVIALSKSRLGGCPDCGYRNASQAKFCSRCGANLATGGQRPARSTLRRNDSGRGW